MYLTRLSLSNFRIFSRLDLELPRRIILLSGGNAQGKTSILEAVAYLANFSSFQATSDRQLINFNSPSEPVQVGRIVAEFQRQNRAHTLEVRLIQEFNGNSLLPRYRRELLLDGVKKRLNELYGQFNAVTFLPQMSRVVAGSPADRRQYLDEVLSQVQRGYASHLADYSKALTQRNALLKTLQEKGGDVCQLEPWDDLLARHGAQIMRARILALDELSTLARPIHQKLTRGLEVLRMPYLPSFEPLPAPKGQLTLQIQATVDRCGVSAEELENGLRQALHTARREDTARGMTTLGPHRDEFRFISNNIDLGDFGSRGQNRTALLALKFAEVEWMRKRTGEWPILLLDEIMAELDLQRRLDLQTVLEEVDQALVTATDPEMFSRAFIDRQEAWEVENGMVRRLTPAHL